MGGTAAGHVVTVISELAGAVVAVAEAAGVVVAEVVAVVDSRSQLTKKQKAAEMRPS